MTNQFICKQGNDPNWTRILIGPILNPRTFSVHALCMKKTQGGRGSINLGHVKILNKALIY